MQVYLTHEAAKQFAVLPQREQKKIHKRLKTLGDDPFAGKALKGDLEHFRSLRVWPYRIIYSIKKADNTLWVSSIAHRQSAYKQTAD